jgi:hypothetical protein
MPERYLARGRHAARYFHSGRLYMRQATEGGGEEDRYVYLQPVRVSLAKALGSSDALFLDFMGGLLTIDERRRLKAKKGLNHPWILQTNEPPPRYIPEELPATEPQQPPQSSLQQEQEQGQGQGQGQDRPPDPAHAPPGAAAATTQTLPPQTYPSGAESNGPGMVAVVAEPQEGPAPVHAEAGSGRRSPGSAIAAAIEVGLTTALAAAAEGLQAAVANVYVESEPAPAPAPTPEPPPVAAERGASNATGGSASLLAPLGGLSSGAPPLSFGGLTTSSVIDFGVTNDQQRTSPEMAALAASGHGLRPAVHRPSSPLSEGQPRGQRGSARSPSMTPGSPTVPRAVVWGGGEDDELEGREGPSTPLHFRQEVANERLLEVLQADGTAPSDLNARSAEHEELWAMHGLRSDSRGGSNVGSRSGSRSGSRADSLGSSRRHSRTIVAAVPGVSADGADVADVADTMGALERPPPPSRSAPWRCWRIRRGTSSTWMMIRHLA